MKKIKNLIYITTAVAGFFMAGCSEDYLDIKPAGKPDELSFFSDTTNVDMMVSGIYNSYLYKENCDLFDMYKWWFGDVPSEMSEGGGDSPTAWGEGYSYDDLSYTPEAGIIKALYGSMLNGVNRASQVIEKLPETRETAGNDMKNKIDIRLAEAHFLRASFYFVLTRVYGGVPVIDHILLPSEYTTLSRGTIKDVYTLMEKDLKTAIQYLPLESQIPANEKGRATKGAAQALLAKMYVYESSYNTYYGTSDVRMGAVQNRWKEAFDLCQEVINSNEYELVGAKGETYPTFWSPTTNGFRYLFSVEGNNNKESVFAIQHIPSTGWGNYSFGGAISQFVGARALLRKDGSFPTQGDHNWGFWVPTHKLYNLFDPNDVRRKVAIGQGPDSISGYPGDSIFGEVTVSGKKVRGWYIIANTTYQATGLENMKYEIGEHSSMIQGNGFQGNPLNIYYIRYADVILLAAEAAMMLNDPSALTYFNMIRARARNCGDGINPVDLTGTVTKKEIMDERAREFAMEGERFFDLVRWKEAYNEINGSKMEWWEDNDSYSGSSVVYQEPKNDFFPLPAIETTKNSNLKQYPGW